MQPAGQDAARAAHPCSGRRGARPTSNGRPRSASKGPCYRRLGFAAQAAIAIKNAALLEDAARHRARLSDEKAYLEEEIQQERGSGEIVGRSPALRAVLRKLDKVAPADTTVLLSLHPNTLRSLMERLGILHAGPRHRR